MTTKPVPIATEIDDLAVVAWLDGERATIVTWGPAFSRTEIELDACALDSLIDAVIGARIDRIVGAAR